MALIVLGLYNGLLFFPVLLLILGPPPSLSPTSDATALPPPTPQPSPPRFKTRPAPRKQDPPSSKGKGKSVPRRHNSDLSLSTIAEETHSHQSNYSNSDSWDGEGSTHSSERVQGGSSTHSSLNGTSVFMEPHITVETSTLPQSVITLHLSLLQPYY